MFLTASVHAVSSPSLHFIPWFLKFYPFFEAQLQPTLSLPLIILNEGISSSGSGPEQHQ